ncbi:hypothetical protein ACFU3O_25695 [Streptomyces antibioticus]
MPSTGKRRATPPTPTQHLLTDEPTQRLTITTATLATLGIDSHGVAA